MSEKTLPATKNSKDEQGALSPSLEDLVQRVSLSQPTNETESVGIVEPRTSDDVKRYVLWPKDGRNESALAKTDDYLKSVTGLPEVFTYTGYDKRRILWLVNVTASQAADIAKEDGVAGIREDVQDKKDANRKLLLSPPAKTSDPIPKVVKREVKYITQINAVSDLVTISQPSTVPNLNDLENYVYESHAGAGVFIYHVESGISTVKTDEFPTAQLEFLLTPLARELGLSTGKDDSETYSHSTCTASKAIGQKYGSAKKATLVVVKMGDATADESYMAFDMVLKDINDKNRKKRSIVTYSRTDTSAIDPNNLDPMQVEELKSVKALLADDIIVVMAAGNDGDQKDSNGNLRVNIDSSPQLFSSDEIPIINVGAADFTGVPVPWSQSGNALTIYGPGLNIRCQDKNFNRPLIKSGSSFAAPSIAGVLATFLAYDQIPFDTSDGNVAANARKFIQNSANWQRKEGAKYIWNGVTEADNPRKAPAPVSTILRSSISSATPTPAPDKNKCHGVSGNVWIDSRDTAVQNVAAFCAQSSKTVEYNQGTGSDLRLSVDYKTDGSKTPQDSPDCHNKFVNIIIDGCDGNDPVNNPYNYKYGSTLTTYDGWTFEMEALATHTDDDNCDVSYRFLSDFFEIRGRNFPTAKFGVDGSGLLQQLRGCGDITKWYFEMTPNDVKYQWYASGYTFIGEKACIGRAVESAGGTDTGNCDGPG